MTRAEMMKELDRIIEVGIVNYKQTVAVREAIPLVKKQIPISPVLKPPYYRCGACNEGIVGIERDGFGHAYCNACGQAVLWK